MPQCQPDELPCHSGECVPASARCNNKYECKDQSDEAGCGTCLILYFILLRFNTMNNYKIIFNIKIIVFGILVGNTESLQLIMFFLIIILTIFKDIYNISWVSKSF